MKLKESCTNSLCKTPKCPYRAKQNSPNQQDLSHSCDYYSPKGDGRWTKPILFSEDNDLLPNYGKDLKEN